MHYLPLKTFINNLILFRLRRVKMTKLIEEGKDC